MENGLKQCRNEHFSIGPAVFSGTSWQCFTMFCDKQQELIILAGTDKCMTSLKMNSIHFEGRRSLQTTKKRLTHPTTCHVCVDTRFTWYQVPESMLHRGYDDILKCFSKRVGIIMAKILTLMRLLL